ncbi:MAG: hypothetical protein Q9217_003124 [Psora testacea]
MSASTSDWAHTQLSHLLPLDPASLTQILEYSTTLSKDAAAEHLKNLLGDSPKALEFISSYNGRREGAVTANTGTSISPANGVREDVPRSARKTQKSKAPLHQLPSRRIKGEGDVGGGYRKKHGEDYMSSTRRNGEPALANTLALSVTPDARQSPKKTACKMPPSAAGQLISDLPNVRSKSQTNSRTASPAPKMKVNVPGGLARHGASTTLEDLSPLKDSAIRTLEVQTNPTLSTSSTAKDRMCNCNATRHPLLTAAPLCLNCGKIICVKEGLGPCTFCHQPLLRPEDLQAMIESLKQERGIQRQQAGNAANRRADVSSTPKPFVPQSSYTPALNPADGTLQKALSHRNKLLEYQAHNAQRTTVHDEAADYTTPASGQNIWSSPAERAKQLKQQQKVLREQEWNAKPEYEKRKTVLSIELGKGGKVLKKTGAVERPKSGDAMNDELEDSVVDETDPGTREIGAGGAFSKNPLMGNLIRPVWTRRDEGIGKGNGKGKGKGKDMDNDDDDDGDDENEKEKENLPRNSAWRRVQDDNDDNEQWILDGGVYGGRAVGF